MKLFKNEQLLFIGTESKLGRTQIIGILKGCSTNTASFVHLYQIYDGVKFPSGAMMFRNKFYTIRKGTWDKIEVEYFLTIKNIIEIKEIRKETNSDIFELNQSHIPFADDGCGNIIWMELSTGIIKVFYHEYELDEGLITIAPTFDDFCSSLENWIL
ncbi:MULTISPECIES: SMI1/KNR4 family protein [unclassified Myroides]|uniref:SMI1/KNR4 family protein n=1 Tax=unclassified Myroides TaxID=2642485 RepID=UPI003D2F57D7